MVWLDEKIELADKKGVVRIRIGIDNKGRPYFSLNGADGRERFYLSVDDDGNGDLAFRTATGQPIVSLGVSSDPDVGSGMMLLDVQSETLLTLRIADGGGEIRLETKQGVHSWPVPSANPCDGSA